MKTTFLAVAIIAISTVSTQSRAETPDRDAVTSSLSAPSERGKAIAAIRFAETSKGDVHHLYTAAHQYREGVFVPQNWRKVAEYLSRAAALEHIQAKYELLYYIQNGKILNVGWKLPNGEIAKSHNIHEYTTELLNKLAEIGHPNALFQTAQLHRNLKLNAKDHEVAAHAYYTLAALEPDPDFLATEEQVQTFLDIRYASNEKIDLLEKEMNVDQLQQSADLGTEIFERILHNLNARNERIVKARYDADVARGVISIP